MIIHYLNRKYDVCSCRGTSENINAGVLSVKTEFMKVLERKTDPRYILVNLYHYYSTVIADGV